MNWNKIIELSIGPIVSFVIMVITLCVQKKHNEVALKEQKAQFEKSFEAQEKHYLENQKESEEKLRLSIMPYLILKSITINEIDGNPFFHITLKNIGNNIATSIIVKREKEPNIIYSYILGDASREYAYSEILFDNILRINGIGKFGITLMCNPKGIVENHIKTFTNIGEIKFSVSFFDIQMNKYSQSFFFQYDVSTQFIGRQETYPPLLEINNCID